MTDLIMQAEAMERLFDAGAVKQEAQPLSEALGRCCVSLLEAGEPERVLVLLDKARNLEADAVLDWKYTVEALRVRALFATERNAECLELARRLLATPEFRLVAKPQDYLVVRIYEGSACWRLNRIDEAIALLLTVRRELLSQPDSTHLAICTLHLSSANNALGNAKEARVFALDALVAARRVGNLFWEGLAYGNLSIADKQYCRWASAEDNGRDSLRVFECLGNSYQLNHARRSLSVVLWKRGRLGEALEHALLCISDAELRGHFYQHWYGTLLRVLVEMHAGHFAEASRLLVGDSRWDLQQSQLRATLLTHEYRADVLLEQAKYAEALDAYDALWPKAMALVPRGDIVAELRRRRAECHLALGRPQRAYEEAKDAVAHCLEISDRYEEACTYRTLALAAAALGKYDEARKQFEHGFAMFDDIETPYEWGKLWVAYGDWLCGANADRYRDLNGAHEAYRAAVDHFEHMGAEYRLAEARERLNKLDALIHEESAALAPVNRKARPLRRPRWSADLQRRSQWAFDTFGMVTRDRSLLEMLEELTNIAKSDLPVLVLGESGTGKELIARGVHDLSGRTGQFVAINCSAIPATMLEDEFFGHVHGAFTSAAGDKMGLLEMAHDGSVFMDEVGEMSLDLQAKLLRFLETNEFRRIGGTKNVRVNTRIVAATNRDREKMQNGDGFRSDLYYRLAHAVYTLPPLRQRGDDVELLVDHFLDLFCEQHHKRVSLSTSARERLLLNHWPGNVRQLRSVMQKIVISAASEHVITPRDLPVSEAEPTAKGLDQELMDQERRRIVDALERTQFVKADAARMLRMSRTSMLAKMKRLGIPG